MTADGKTRSRNGNESMQEIVQSLDQGNLKSDKQKPKIIREWCKAVRSLFERIVVDVECSMKQRRKWNLGVRQGKCETTTS